MKTTVKHFFGIAVSRMNFFTMGSVNCLPNSVELICQVGGVGEMLTVMHLPSLTNITVINQGLNYLTEANSLTEKRKDVFAKKIFK